MDAIRRALEQSGVNAASLDRIRLARGIVGKASYVALAAILMLGGAAGGIAWTLHDPTYVIAIAILIVLVFMSYLIGSLWFANRHPGVALLEGAEPIQWRQMDVAARTSPGIEDRPVSEPEDQRSNQ